MARPRWLAVPSGAQTLVAAVLALWLAAAAVLVLLEIVDALKP